MTIITPTAEQHSRYVTTALAASGVIKASAGKLLGAIGYNDKTSTQFIQIFNSATVPSDTAVPIFSFVAQSKANFSLDFGTLEDDFDTGISWSNSSTVGTKTIGSADCWVTALFR